MKNYYQTLEIAENSSAEEIKQAYRNLAKRYHPDVNKSPEAHERFIEITEAYEVLLHRQDQHEEFVETFNYDEFIREVRESAKKQARMRYEKFERQQFEFRESGLYDIALLLKYIGRVLLPFVALGLVSLPIIVCINEKSIQPFFYLFLFWIIGGFILYYIYQDKQRFFRLGKFYYSYAKIRDLYVKTNENATDNCFYCSGLKANSIPYNFDLIKVKDVKLRNYGPMQHQAGYDQKNITIVFPRSKKAFIIHSISSAIRFFSILFALVLFPIDSIAWRIILGIVTGWFLSNSLLFVSGTRSKTSYFISYAMIIKGLLWLTMLGIFSKFDLENGNIVTTDFIYFGCFALLFADAFIEQLLKLPAKNYLFKPISKRYNSINHYFEQKCLLYLEIPFWTTFYPLFRWIF